MREDGIAATQKTLNILLESGLRVDNSDIIVEALEKIREIGRTADPWIIRILTKMFDLPDRIYAELKQHHLPYNFMNKLRAKTFTPASFIKKSRMVPKSLFRVNDKRIKLRK